MKMQRGRKVRTFGTSLTMVLAGSICITGCSVEKTEDGELPDVDISADAGELPDYDIVKKDDGRMPDVDLDVDGGNLPSFDVDVADIDVGMTEETVQVPKLKVVMEEETVKVPNIDIDMPGNDEKIRRTLIVDAEVPHTGYSLAIDEVYADNDEIIVLSRLHDSGKGEPNPNRVQDQVVINAPDMDVKYYVLGSEPEGVDNDNLEFISTISEIDSELKSARQIYKRS